MKALHKTIIRFHIFMAFILSIFSFTNAYADSERTNISLNRSWEFKFDNGKLDDFSKTQNQAWSKINVPHSFSTPYFLGEGFYVGYGHYKKTIELPKNISKKSTYLEFDGVFQEAEIYINGKKAGAHTGGYTGFSIDISPYVQAGNNEIIIRVNNLWNARVAPRAGEHVFSGGIYRNVRLVITNKVRADWYGTFIYTKNITDNAASVGIDTEIVNNYATPQDVKLVSKIYDPKGVLVGKVTNTTQISPNSKIIIKQNESVKKPNLWSPTNPALYNLKTEIYVAGKKFDDFQTKFGIRTVSVTKDNGFFLNGEHLYLVGANVHQDHAGWGDAITDSAAYRDVKLIKDAGFNFIRGSHYPHSPAFSNATDNLGIVMWSEAPFWGIGGFAKDGNWHSSAYPPKAEDQADFEKSVLQQIDEMIRIHRNHPSIAFWSTSNEPFFTDYSVYDKMHDLLKIEVAHIKAIDPTRIVAIGGAQRGNIDSLGDIAGYNGDGATLYLKPPSPSIVSEYGSTITKRPGEYEPGWGLLPEPTDQKGSNEKYPWRYKWRAGEALWAGFDHGSIASVEFGEMGMIDYFRIPKRQYYWYRNEYMGIKPPEWPKAGTPAKLSLSASNNVIKGTDGLDDSQIFVSVLDKFGKRLSNSPDITLSIISGPGEFPTGRKITFKYDSPILIRDGIASIEMHSYYAGETVIKANSEGLLPAYLKITNTGSPAYKKGESFVKDDRPYIQYPAMVRIEEKGTQINVTVNRPTSASSKADNHNSSLANDGNDTTYWAANPSDKNPILTLDLENIYAINHINIASQCSKLPEFSLEVSENGNDWKTIARSKSNENSVEFALDPRQVIGRWVKAVFDTNTNITPCINEFKVITNNNK